MFLMRTFPSRHTVAYSQEQFIDVDCACLVVPARPSILSVPRPLLAYRLCDSLHRKPHFLVSKINTFQFYSCPFGEMMQMTYATKAEFIDELKSCPIFDDIRNCIQIAKNHRTCPRTSQQRYPLSKTHLLNQGGETLRPTTINSLSVIVTTTKPLPCPNLQNFAIASWDAPRDSENIHAYE